MMLSIKEKCLKLSVPKTYFSYIHKPNILEVFCFVL